MGGPVSIPGIDLLREGKEYEPPENKIHAVSLDLKCEIIT